MKIDETFSNLVTFLRIDPTGERVDQLLAELVSQVALSIHNNSKSHQALRCVKSDLPSVYYALDDLLRDYGYQLTVKRGLTKGIVILGIRPITQKTPRKMPLGARQKPVTTPPASSGAVV